MLSKTTRKQTPTPQADAADSNETPAEKTKEELRPLARLKHHFAAADGSGLQMGRDLVNDVEKSQRCRVHCERLSAVSGHAVLTIACPDTPELLSMICGLFLRSGWIFEKPVP